jgi:hypothetical protein
VFFCPSSFRVTGKAKELWKAENRQASFVEPVSIRMSTGQSPKLLVSERFVFLLFVVVFAL